MIKDQGPIYNLGFGVQTRQLGWQQGDTTPGPNPEGSTISKALHDHPIMKFFAASATTMVGMAVAGAVARKGGVKLAVKLQEGSGWQTDAIRNVRRVRDIMDDWQGITRDTAYHEAANANKLFIDDPNGALKYRGKNYSDGNPKQLKGWFFTKNELETARRTGAPPPSEWTISHEIQQRMVGQARRLPYELPAAYLTQRAFTDRVFGEDQKSSHVNWYNPVDVISDFVIQSTKNAAFMLSPFEVGIAGAKQGWRKAMTYGDDMVNMSPRQLVNRDRSVALKTVLNEVGHDASQIINQTVRLSSQSAGAFATGVNTARESSMSYTDFLNRFKHGWKAELDKIDQKAISKARKWEQKSRYLIQHDALDVLPGPFRGISSGAKEASKKWTAIGHEYQAMDEMMVLGRKRYMAKYGSDPQRMKALARVSAQSETSIEALTTQLNKMGGFFSPFTQSGAVDPQFKNGSFYSQRMGELYNSKMTRELKKAGVSDDALNVYNKAIGLDPAVNKHIAQRVFLGNSTAHIKANDSLDPDFWQTLVGRLGIKDPTQAQTLQNALPGALQKVDEIFKNKNYLGLVDRRIAREWSHVQKRAFPAMAEEVIGKSRLPYDMFRGELTHAKKQYLVRKSAQQSGMGMVDNLGNPVSDAAARSWLLKSGIDADNTDQLRGYLVQNKAIGKPWHKGARNVFGLQQVSVLDAVGRGYFAKEGTSKDVRQLVNIMEKNDPVSNLGDFRLRGVYQTSSGQIVDFNRIRSKGTTLMDKLADQFQIPLIHTSPLNLLGFQPLKEQRQAAIVQYRSAKANQAFLSGRKENDEFYLWMKSRGKGRKGFAMAFQNQDGKLVNRRIAGTFTSRSTTGTDIGARHLRLALGEKGQIPAESGTSKRADWLRKVFNVDRDQPDSVWGWMKRFRQRNEDINNPKVLARLLREEEIEIQGVRGKLDPSTGAVINPATGNELIGAEKVSEGLANLSAMFKAQGLPAKLSGKFKNVFQYDIKNETTTLRSLPGTTSPGKISVDDLDSPLKTVEFAEQILRQEPDELSYLPKEIQDSLRRARKLLVERHLKPSSGNGSYWDQTLPGASGRGTITTRQDQLKSDMQQYLAIRAGLVRQGRSFEDIMAPMGRELRDLKARGEISDAEFTEAKAALLGMQIDYASIAAYSGRKGVIEHAQDTVGRIMSSPETRGLLSEVTEGRVGANLNLPYATRIQQAVRKNFGSAPYKYDGVEYNPFGDARVLVPTLGTSWANNPLGTLASVTGIKTWGSPETFTGASIPGAHMIERLNRYADIVGLALDPTKYHGPVDMYVRGMIGQRALPLTAGAAGIFTVDRTLGGFVNPKDQDGERVYSPLFFGGAAKGVAQGQMLLAGALPGGQSYSEKKEELEGDVAVRAGRWWPLGNTPWGGGRIQYYRPSWIRRLEAGHLFTDQTYGSPLERLAFDYDFSPLRPLDPYHFERQHKEDRPYPTTGEYFTGPWGPLTSVLNMTAGRILKPKLNMHEDELAQGLASYAPVGMQGAYMPTSTMPGGEIGVGGQIGFSGTAVAAGGGGGRAFGMVGSSISESNANLASEGRASLSTGRDMAFGAISDYNKGLSAAAYGPPAGGFPPRIIGGAPPISTRDLGYQFGKLGYETQELMGIYGFGLGAIRDSLGLGSADFTGPRPVLESASKAYGSARGFWDMNLGGLGDMPQPFSEGSFANLELSEIVRRFIPRERSGVEYVNPIANTMGRDHPWLPGSDYFTNFHTGDPFVKIQEGEMRLPGQGYERFNKLHPDQYGEYGLLDMHKILGDVAPWSSQYKSVNKMVESQMMSPQDMAMVQQTREQVYNKSIEHEFSPYKYKYSSPDEMDMRPTRFYAAKFLEGLAHKDTYLNTKFSPDRSAVEDWERESVYGATFPQWQNPIEDFVRPMAYKATQRNPLAAASAMGLVGSLFGKPAPAKAMGAIIGGGIGFFSSVIGKSTEALTGERYIPLTRKKEIALEEYTDILSYVKNTSLAKSAEIQGDSAAASTFTRRAKQTMYGADIQNATVEELSMAIPKRKREHFMSMATAPEQERDRILSTSGRLERRLLQGVWGRKVEKLPELEEYFENRELPGPEWEGWHPNTNMEAIKIKIGQHMGLDMSQMGYYPQQVREANLINASYPALAPVNNPNRTAARLRQMMYEQGVSGDVYPIQTPFGGDRIQFNAGVY